MSTTQTIEISFTVDVSVADTSRVMDGLIAHIQAIGGTRDLKAIQKRVIEQWWTNPLHHRQVGDDIYPSPPTLQRQQAVQPIPGDASVEATEGGHSLSFEWPVMEPTEEPSEATRAAFPSPTEESESASSQAPPTEA